MAIFGWLALFAAPIANATERGVVLVYEPQGEQAKSDTARTALVIGNGTYSKAPLRNPVNDAKDVAEALRGLGFEVVLSLDVNKQVLKEAMRKFRQRLQRRGGVGLFYYAGHGIQVRGRNYLIPVKADIETEADVEYAAVDAGLVLRYMEEAEARLNIVVLDACRDNPYERSWRSASRGLVRLEMPQGPLGSLLAYSTGPGKVAADGSGRNSPFTKHLLQNLGVTGLKLEDVFKETRKGVKKETFGKQVPWSESSLVGDFYFQKSTLSEARPPVTVPRPDKRPPQEAKLTVRSNVYGDQVYIDGEARGSTRLDLDLAPGRHTVRVEKEAYEPYEETVDLEAGGNLVVRASLAPVVAERPEPAIPTPAAETTTPKTGSKPRAGESWTEPITGMEFAWIPPGCFQMGSPKTEEGRYGDEHQHQVCVAGFWLSKYEVTNAQYRRFRSDHDSDVFDRRQNSLNGDAQPVVNVDWHAAAAFAAWLSQKTGERLRLPTEAEWEYAARADTETARYWGDDPGSDKTCTYANVYDETSKTYVNWGWVPHDCDDGYTVTAPVGRFRPNSFGLYDNLGNAWEWTCSVYDKDYRGAEKNCASEGNTARRVIRGGSWGDRLRTVRSAFRARLNFAYENKGVGFRLARTP